MGEHLPYKQRVIGSSPIVSIEVLLLHGLVVQLVRTLACHARGQGFESPSGRSFCRRDSARRLYIYADLAHLVERNLAKVEVAGPSPVIRLRMADSSSPSSFFIFFSFSPNLFSGPCVLMTTRDKVIPETRQI